MAIPRILIIENSIDVTGALKSITREAYDLKGHFDFQFIIPKGSKGRIWIEGEGFSINYELPMKEISRKFSSLLLYIPFLFINTIRLQRIVKRERISIIHVNDLYNLLPVMLRLFGVNIPYVCHIRFLPDRFPPWLFNFWLRLHLRYASKVVAVSQSALNMLPAHPKLMYIHNELPLGEQFPELTELDNLKPSFTFLYLSNFIKGKGQNYALEAYSKIYEELPDWKLRFVGGDMGLKKNREYRMELQERAKELGFFEKTEWLGFTEVVELEYKKADVVLNFSESESFSFTCLEALYFGRPVIATACGGPSEVIDDEQTGILVPNRNINAMARAMKRIAANDGMRRKMSLTARAVVRDRFSVEKTSFKWKEEYEQILMQAK